MLANKHEARASGKRSMRFHKQRFASNFLYWAYKSGTAETWTLVPCPFGLSQISTGSCGNCRHVGVPGGC